MTAKPDHVFDREREWAGLTSFASNPHPEALLGVVGGEIIASEHGLGQTLTVLAASFKTNGVFGIIFLLSMIGVGISWGMTSLENRLLRWR